MSSAYAESGVNIDSGNRAVTLMRDAVSATYNSNVLAGIGAFGGLFDAQQIQSMRAPVLVASTDGVGTKVKIAAQANRYDNIGRDLVNHCINDILVQGARPLFFMDYIAASKTLAERVAAIVTSMAAACHEANMALLGGETAEMPGVYHDNEFDVAGTIVGVVEREDVLPRTDLNAGDILVGLGSTGAHTNGYSLIRKVFEGVPLDTVFPELGVPLANSLLAPHRSYLPMLEPFVAASRTGGESSPIKALAHITGGGIVENLPHVLPEHISANIHLGSWKVPALFDLIQQRGNIATAEMFRVFNMGVGMIVVVSKNRVTEFRQKLGHESFVIGELVAGERNVVLTADG